MNPLAASIAFGLLKGALKARPTPPAPRGAYTTGPLTEELVYRAFPLGITGGRLPFGSTAVHFAADHLRTEKTPAPVVRFADVLAGGLLYEYAYRRYGFFGAWACHAAHNLACTLGSKLRGPR